MFGVQKFGMLCGFYAEPDIVRFRSKLGLCTIAFVATLQAKLIIGMILNLQTKDAFSTLYVELKPQQHLTHCGLGTQYGTLAELAAVAWWHQAIALTSVGLSLMISKVHWHSSEGNFSMDTCQNR